MAGKKKTVKSRKKSTKKKQNNKSAAIISLTISIILLLILVSVSVTYAFWTSSQTQTKQNEIDAGCLSFSFNDKNVEGNTTNISMMNAYPISDDSGVSLTPYIFTVTNTCTIDANFFIYLHNFNTSTIESKYIKLHLSDINDSPVIATTLVNEINPGTLSNDISSVVEQKFGTIKETYLLNEFVLKPEESATYNIRMWIDYYAPNSIMGLSYDSAISAFATTPE